MPEPFRDRYAGIRLSMEEMLKEWNAPVSCTRVYESVNTASPPPGESEASFAPRGSRPGGPKRS